MWAENAWQNAGLPAESVRGHRSGAKEPTMTKRTEIAFDLPSDLPAGAIWPFLADFHAIHRISPLVRRTTALTERSCEVGAERICHMDLGMGVRERVSAWNEGESYSIDILEMSAPIREGRATLGVRPSGRGSVIFMRLGYLHRFGAVGWLMDRLMTRPMMTLVVRWFVRTIDARVRAGLPAPRHSAA